MSKTREKNTNEKKADLSATGIVKLAEEAPVKLFHTPAREPYVSFFVKGHWETWPVKSPEFEHWLSAMCYYATGMVSGRNGLAAAMTTLAGRALYSNPEKTVNVRLAGHDGEIYFDLGNDDWEAVKITGEGWKIVSDVPVKFRRASGMLPLPRPIAGGSVGDLRSFLNCDDEEQWTLIVSWLLGALRPLGPTPLLILEGNHGSAKTTSAKLLLALVDPNISPLRAEPTSPRDLAIWANNSWCVGLDNLSSMPHWLSDALCRLSTGGGFSTRALYTDSAEKIFEGTRPVLLNGIDIGIERGDLLDRSIRLELPPISEERRETEKKLWERFEASRPFILGSLLDAVACGLRGLPEAKASKLPRMADFATWVCAAEPALGWQEGSFLEAYRQNLEESNSLALEASELVPLIAQIAERGMWQGTSTELLEVLRMELLNVPVSEHTSFPKTARELSQAMRRLAPNLLQVGVTVKFHKTPGDNSRRMISISKSDGAAPDAVPKESVEN